MNLNRFYLTLLSFFILISLTLGCKKNEGSGPAQPDAVKISINTDAPLTAAGGETITITGAGLMSGSGTQIVKLNDKLFPVKTADGNSMTVTVPKLVGSGKLMIEINGHQFEGPQFTYVYKATVTTVAGNGSAGTSDGNALSSSFNFPWGIVSDITGNLYVADCYSRLIKKIDVKGKKVTNIKIPSSTIDGLQGGEFFSPYNIAIDTLTNELFVTDFNKHILKISPSLQFSVIIDDMGVFPTTGIAIGPDNRLYVSNNSNGKIYKMDRDGSNVTPYASSLATPRNIVFDNNQNMYVSAADGTSPALFKIKNGSAEKVFQDVEGQGWETIADKSGNFIEADFFKNRLRMIEKNGRIFTLAGSGKNKDVDGIDLEASFNGPRGITIDNKGNIYITTDGNKVRKVVVE